MHLRGNMRSLGRQRANVERITRRSPASLCVSAPIPLHQKFYRAVAGKKVVGRSRGECFRMSVGAPSNRQPNIFRVTSLQFSTLAAVC